MRKVVRWRWRYIPKNVRVYVSRVSYVVLWVNNGGLVYGGALRRFIAAAADGQRAEVMDTVWEGPMKRKTIEQLAGVRTHADPKGLVDTYPDLAEFMTVAVFETDGKLDRRESPTLTVWCAGGQWKCAVKDRAEGLVMWLSAETWMQLLQMVDLFVLDDGAPWRHDEGERQGRRVK